MSPLRVGTELDADLSPAGFDGIVPQLASDTARNALVVRQLYDGTDYSIQFAAARPLATSAWCSTCHPHFRVWADPVAIAAERRALVVWSSYDGTTSASKPRDRLPDRAAHCQCDSA